MDDQRDPMSVLDWCVYDFLMGRNLNHLAEQFATETNVNVNGMDSVGYLTDWWLLCWEMYHSRSHRRAMEERHIQGAQINTNQFPTTNLMQMPLMNQFPSNMQLSRPVQSVASQAYSLIPPAPIDQGSTHHPMQMPQMNQQRRMSVPLYMHSSSLDSNMNSRAPNVERSVDLGHGQQFANESIQQLFVNESNQQQDEHATDMGRTVSVNLPNEIGLEVRTNSEPVEAPPLVSGRKGKESSSLADHTIDQDNSQFPQSQIDREIENLADGVDIGSFLCNDEEENYDATNNITERNGFTFQEAGRLNSFLGKLVCCDFSPNGKLLASGGHDKKVTIWNMESFNYISTGEEHNQLITDVRFGADSIVFGTSSFDRTVRIWDLNNVTKSIVKLDGHAEQVTSLDFHSQKNLLCSCDMGGSIRLWDVEIGLCSGVLQGASKKIRFMPGSVDLLVAADGNMIGMFDTNTSKFQSYLQGHVREVRSLCWDSTGSYLVSVSEDSTRIWSPMNSTRSVHVLPSDGCKFESCTFHPGYSQLVVIGSYQKLILWNPPEMKRFMEIPCAHEGLEPPTIICWYNIPINNEHAKVDWCIHDFLNGRNMNHLWREVCWIFVKAKRYQMTHYIEKNMNTTLFS